MVLLTDIILNPQSRSTSPSHVIPPHLAQGHLRMGEEQQGDVEVLATAPGAQPRPLPQQQPAPAAGLQRPRRVCRGVGGQRVPPQRVPVQRGLLRFDL